MLAFGSFALAAVTGTLRPLGQGVDDYLYVLMISSGLTDQCQGASGHFSGKVGLDTLRDLVRVPPYGPLAG